MNNKKSNEKILYILKEQLNELLKEIELQLTEQEYQEACDAKSTLDSYITISQKRIKDGKYNKIK